MPFKPAADKTNNTSNKKNVLFVLSVDTEEEFDWRGEFPEQECNVDNIQELPEFQQFCESLSIRPTYFVDYPVAATTKSANTLKKIALSGNAEIGAHLHPWCTPPFQGNNTERESHVVNLPGSLVSEKLRILTQQINENIGVNPIAFRTGRWGINDSVMKAVIENGYQTDSSIYPYYANEYFSCEHAYDMPYWPDISCPDNPGTQRDIFELPVTAGFNRANFPFWGKVHRLLSHPVISLARPIGLAWKINLLRKLYLSPELTSAEDMINLTNSALQSNHPVIQMFLHSSTLLPGHNEFTHNKQDKLKLLNAIQQVVNYLQTKANITFCTISEASQLLQKGFENYHPPLSPSDASKAK